MHVTKKQTNRWAEKFKKKKLKKRKKCERKKQINRGASGVSVQVENFTK